MAKVLTTLFKVKGYNKVEVFQEKTKVRGNGNFSLPDVLKEFKTPEEAKAFIQGAAWAVGYFGGEVRNYGAESTENYIACLSQ